MIKLEIYRVGNERPPGAVPQYAIMDCCCVTLGRAIFCDYVAMIVICGDIIYIEFAPTPNVSKLVGDIP
jgi:hypothetical protein